MTKKILIVDDEEDIRMLVQGVLEDEGYAIETAQNCAQAYQLIDNMRPDLIIQDIWLQGSEDDGIEILQKTKKQYPLIPFIMISGHGTIETAVEAIKLGAYDFIEKPFKSDRLLMMIERALENTALKLQNEALKNRAFNNIQTQANALPSEIKNTLTKAANTNSRIFITGEAGTGKNIAAQYLHECSARSDFPFLTLNCVGTSSEQLEEELFGTPTSEGLLSLAHGGTLVLDEVLSLPLNTQGKLLTALQEMAYRKGDLTEKIPFDVRILSTSSGSAEEQILARTFREDLYYRLNVVNVHLPPLKARKKEIPEIIESFSPYSYTAQAQHVLQTYSWPGNVKQFLNVLEWINIMNDPSQTQEIDVHNLPPEFSGKKNTANDDMRHGQDSSSSMAQIMEGVTHLGLREAREHFEKHYLLEQLDKFDGNISKTAEQIGMERSALHRKLKSLNVFSDDKQNVA